MHFARIACLVALLFSACGNQGETGTAERRPTVIYVSVDAEAAQPPPSTGGEDGAVTPSKADAGSGPTPDDGGVRVCPEQTRFPSCKGTVDEVSDCIMNLPSSFGLQVITSEPMDYNACKNL